MFGFIISFGIRCNVGVATVKMMSNTTDDEGNIVEISEFHWSPETIGYVDASFFWGYIVTQLPGGFLAFKFPSTKLDPKAVIVVRVLQGLVEGVTYPSCHGIWRWR